MSGNSCLAILCSSRLALLLMKSRDPHPIFVIILVGPEEQPFGIQKDFLCARSAHYKKLFTGEDGQTNTVEHIVSLPETPVEVFAYAQNYLFTGRVFPNSEHLPSYDILIGVWKLGHHLEIDGLCEATLDAMSECRRITQLIPATPLLVQVWEDTPEGSSIRKLLLSWAAEYMRSSDSRAEFARSLPQGVLSELVVAMSSLDNDSPIPTASTSSSSTAGQKRPGAGAHCVEVEDGDEAQPPASKRARHSDVVPREATSPAPSKAAIKKPPLRASLPASKPAPRRRSGAASSDLQWSTQQKLTFCSDLLTRMLSGPGKSPAGQLLLSQICRRIERRYSPCTDQNDRLLDATSWPFQGTCGPFAGRRARLPREGDEANGLGHHEGKNGPQRVRKRGRVRGRHEPDLQQLLHILVQEGRHVGRLRALAEDV